MSSRSSPVTYHEYYLNSDWTAKPILPQPRSQIFDSILEVCYRAALDCTDGYFPKHVARGSIFEKTEENDKERKVNLLKVLDFLRTVRRIFHDRSQQDMRGNVFARMRWDDSESTNDQRH